MTHSEHNPLPNVARELGENMRPDIVDSMAPRGTEGRDQIESAMQRLEQSIELEKNEQAE